MSKYSKFNIVCRLQKWMDSVAGQTFMNYAYSWGAAVVILGTLFKLTHLQGADIMLFIGMGTEVFVFFIAAFDRPFDKTTDGMTLATDSELAAQLSDSDEEGKNGTDKNGMTPTIILGGASNIPETIVLGNPGTACVGEGNNSTEGNSVSGELNMGASNTVGGNFVVGTPSPAVTQETAEAMEEATTTYVDRLNELNEVLLKVGAQSERLTTDSQEMENLNRTLTGISRVYEMQLKSASQQITTQDEINEQTRRLAQQIAELNAIYARMIEAMSVNMKQ